MPYIWLVGLVYFGMTDNTWACLYWCLSILAVCELAKLAVKFVDLLDKEIQQLDRFDKATLIEMYIYNVYRD